MSRRQLKTVKKSLEKAKDAALLAVETYNKPAVKFRSGGYIVMMTIAWTALFHAIFFQRRVKPFYRQKGSTRFEIREGDFCYWDLQTCLSEYYKTDTINAVRKNLEFFIPLRNKIEHKSLPEIDPDIFAECQSMLLNFDKMLEIEFGEEYCIRESLSFSLQLFPSSKSLLQAAKANPDAKSAVKFIEKYRSTLSTEILESGDYSFKAFLIQVANHQSKEALPVQFIRYDQLSDEEKINVKRVTALIKEKIVEKSVSNMNLLLPSKVVKFVQNGIGNPKLNRNGKIIDKFNPDTHTRCWKKYQVRPKSGTPNPQNTNEKYCIYDNLTSQYGFTIEWVRFLIDKMKDEKEYESLFK